MQTLEKSKAFRLLKHNAIKNILPLSVLVELTFKCNLNCICCYNVKSKGKPLNLKDYNSLFKELREAGTFIVTLTGGEPFMRPDIFHILELLKKHQFAFRVFTNGTLLDKAKILRLKECNPAGIELSIWGSSPEINDKLMGKKGAFKKITEVTKLLNKQNISTTVKTTVCSENYQDFGNIKKLASDLGAQFRYSLALTLKTNGDPSNNIHRMTEEQMKEFYQLYNILFDTKEFEKDKINDEVLNEYKNLPDYMCLAGISSCMIDPFGNVFPCVDIPIVAGNIRKKKFSKIWETSSILNHIRNLRKECAEECLRCIYKDNCHRCPGMAFMESGSLTAKYNYGCLLASADYLYRRK